RDAMIEYITKGQKMNKYDNATDYKPNQAEHEELFETISKGQYKYDDTENGAKSTLVAIMERMATYSGQIIDFDTTLNSGISLQPERYAFDANPPVLPDENGFYPIAQPGV